MNTDLWAEQQSYLFQTKEIFSKSSLPFLLLLLGIRLFFDTYSLCTYSETGSQMNNPKRITGLRAETMPRIWEWREWNGPPAIQTHGGLVGSAGACCSCLSDQHNHVD